MFLNHKLINIIAVTGVTLSVGLAMVTTSVKGVADNEIVSPNNEIKSKVSYTNKTKNIDDKENQKAEVDKKYKSQQNDLLTNDIDVDHTPDSFVVTFKSKPDEKVLQKITKSKYVGDGISTKLNDLSYSFKSENLNKNKNSNPKKVSTALKNVIKEVSKFSEVEYIDPDVTASPASVIPNDTFFGNQSTHRNTGQYAGSSTSGVDLKTYNAWDYTQGTPNTIIAIVDTGTDLDNPDLAGQFWTNPGEIAGNGIDDDGNGYADDINGWNFLQNNNNVEAPSTDNYHGSLISGIIGAKSNNSIGIAGTCSSCKIMPIKGLVSGSSSSYIVSSITYALSKGASIINLSLVIDSYSAALETAVNNAYNAGVSVFAGSGNTNGNIVMYPAAFANAISVTALDDKNHKESYATYNSYVDLAVPISHVVSTYNSPTQPYGDISGNAGTSSATAFASGVAGLLKSYARGLTPLQIVNVLKTTVTDVYTDNPTYAGLLGAGRINAQAALEYLAAPNDTIPDLVWRGNTGENSVWKLNNNGTLNGGAILPTVTDTNFKIKFTPDIDGDGISDLVWQNSSTGQPAIWIMNSNGTIKSSTLVSTFTPGTVWQIVGVGQFTPDTTPDLLWRDTSGNNSVWKLDSSGNLITGGFSLPTVTDTNFKIKFTPDIDGDGISDLVWQNISTGQPAIWIMNSNGTIKSSTLVSTFTPGTVWQIVGVGQFTPDTTPDLLWRDTSGNNSVWKLDSSGNLITGGFSLPTVTDTNFKIKFTPDIDGDGISDLVWQNISTGQPAIWIMNSNGTIKSSTFVATFTPGTSYEIVGVGKFR